MVAGRTSDANDGVATRQSKPRHEPSVLRHESVNSSKISWIIFRKMIKSSNALP
jgi:hypothetical protein